MIRWRRRRHWQWRCAEGVDIARFVRLALQRVVRALHQYDGYVPLRLELPGRLTAVAVLQDAADDLVWPERKRPSAEAARAVKMRKGNYLLVYNIAGKTVQQARPRRAQGGSAQVVFRRVTAPSRMLPNDRVRKASQISSSKRGCRCKRQPDSVNSAFSSKADSLVIFRRWPHDYRSTTATTTAIATVPTTLTTATWVAATASKPATRAGRYALALLTTFTSLVRAKVFMINRAIACVAYLVSSSRRPSKIRHVVDRSS